ncbi:MAG: alpha-(1-2)-phosphatidylinositol mannosyltransferase, partial [Mycobacterium sp.]
PERHRRSAARRRAEMFTWQRAAAGMLTTFSAAPYGDSADTA